MNIFVNREQLQLSLQLINGHQMEPSYGAMRNIQKSLRANKIYLYEQTVYCFCKGE